MLVMNLGKIPFSIQYVLKVEIKYPQNFLGFLSEILGLKCDLVNFNGYFGIFLFT